jgi:hyaluronan synthase
MIYGILMFGTVLSIMFIPIIISLSLNFSIFRSQGYFTLSVYGLYMVFYMCLQMIFAYFNRHRVLKINKDSPEISGKYNLLVVGFREDPILFRNCLKSIMELSHSENLHRIFVVIDGNEAGDEYMAKISHDILRANVIHMTELLSKDPEIDILDGSNSRYICILQPHKGKRHALYTGLKLSCQYDLVDGVLCTDSDTVLGKDSLYYLSNLLESDEKYGAVTGNVEIVNKNSFISLLSSYRYWFACNLERGYQSFNNCVLCVSGPLGLYKTECLNQFLELWVNQKFMKKECTYGDDRHLTNNILMLGKRVGYTQLATCFTESPETFSRFFTQQIRWCKSSIREFGWNLKSIDKHSPWMTIDLIYQTVYSFLVLGSLIYIMFFGSTFQLLVYFTTLMVINAMKGLYAYGMSGDPEYILFTFYGIVYICFLAPAKLYAGITLTDTDWGTSTRIQVLDKLKPEHIFLVLWNLVIIGGVSFNIYRNHQDYGQLEIAIAGSVGGYIILVMLIIYGLSFRKRERLAE